MDMHKSGKNKFRISPINFSGTGMIGQSSYDIRGHMYLRAALEGVGGGNIVAVQGRILGQTNWTTIITITGTSDGFSVDCANYDEVRFNCTTYSASGTPTLIASGFYDGSGLVSALTGSGVANAVALWSDTSTLTYSANLTFDGSALALLGTFTITNSSGPHLTIKDGGTAGSNADPYMRFMDASTEMGYLGFPVSNSLNMYVSNLKNGSLILGAGNTNLITISNAANAFDLRRDANGATRAQVRNLDTGASAYARFTVSSDAGDVNLDANSLAAGAIASLNVDSTFTAGFEISLGGARTFGVRTNGTLALTVDGNQNVKISKSNDQPILQLASTGNNWYMQIAASGNLEFVNNAVSQQVILTQAGQLRIVGGLGIGFATTGVSTLGTVVARFPVHDTSGTLVGYAALYDSIT